MKKLISLMLCIILVVSTCSICVMAQDKRTDCTKSCGFYPTIIVPGLGQSSVCVLDENGEFILNEDGKKVSAFPAYVEIPKLIATIAVPVILSLITQNNVGLSDALSDAIELCFGINGSDLNGKNTGNVKLLDFPYSYAECNDEQKQDIDEHIPFNMYPTDLPDDHIYYFTYNSFGNHIDIVDSLYDYIQLVKEQTGHSRVNLVPLSQGASVASALFDYYPNIGDTLHKIMFVVPALDGSNIIGDVFNGRINFLNKEYFYNGFLEEMGLLDSTTAHLIELVLRIFPDEVLMDGLNAAVDTLVGSIMTKSTSMWALCPSGDYMSARKKYLSEPEMSVIREQTDKYYKAQLNAHSNIIKLQNQGVQFFCVAEYNMNLINVGENWNSQNADYIIQLDSTSLGAYSVKVGETLPSDYVQQNTVCKNKNHNHISPDRMIDASTGLLPDTTFYFSNQRHDLTQHNDVILKLAMELIASDDIKDVYSSPDFPQFLNGIEVRKLNTALKTANEAISSGNLTDIQRADLQKAIDDGYAVLSDNLKAQKDLDKAENNINVILADIGLIEIETKTEIPLFEKISHWLYENYGTDGYSEIIKAETKNIFNKFKQLYE